MGRLLPTHSRALFHRAHCQVALHAFQSPNHPTSQLWPFGASSDRLLLLLPLPLLLEPRGSLVPHFVSSFSLQAPPFANPVRQNRSFLVRQDDESICERTLPSRGPCPLTTAITHHRTGIYTGENQPATVRPPTNTPQFVVHTRGRSKPAMSSDTRPANQRRSWRASWLSTGKLKLRKQHASFSRLPDETEMTSPAASTYSLAPSPQQITAADSPDQSDSARGYPARPAFDAAESCDTTPLPYPHMPRPTLTDVGRTPPKNRHGPGQEHVFLGLQLDGNQSRTSIRVPRQTRFREDERAYQDEAEYCKRCKPHLGLTNRGQRDHHD